MLVPLGQDQGIAVVFGGGLVGEGVGDVRLLHGFFVDASPFVQGKAGDTCFSMCFGHPKLLHQLQSGCFFGWRIQASDFFAGKSFWGLRYRGFLWLWRLWALGEFCSFIFQTSPCRHSPRGHPFAFCSLKRPYLLCQTQNLGALLRGIRCGHLPILQDGILNTPCVR